MMECNNESFQEFKIIPETSCFSGSVIQTSPKEVTAIEFLNSIKTECNDSLDESSCSNLSKEDGNLVSDEVNMSNSCLEEDTLNIKKEEIESDLCYMRNDWSTLAKLDIPVVPLFHDKVEKADCKETIYSYKEPLISYKAIRSNLTLFPEACNYIYQCHHCNVKMKEKTGLRLHIESVHLKLKKYKCTLCKYRSNFKNNVTIHYNAIHKKIKPFSCPHCSYRSERKSKVQFHIECVHLKIERPKNFLCHLCNFKCSLNSLLLTHIQITHYKLKPFSCHLCDRVFGRKIFLRDHINFVHKKIKKFSCEFCDYRCSRKDYLNKHVAAKHVEHKNFNCGHCNYSTSRKDFFKIHMSRHHPDVS